MRPHSAPALVRVRCGSFSFCAPVFIFLKPSPESPPSPTISRVPQALPPAAFCLDCAPRLALWVSSVRVRGCVVVNPQRTVGLAVSTTLSTHTYTSHKCAPQSSTCSRLNVALHVRLWACARCTSVQFRQSGEELPRPVSHVPEAVRQAGGQGRVSPVLPHRAQGPG